MMSGGRVRDTNSGCDLAQGQASNSVRLQYLYSGFYQRRAQIAVVM